MVSATGRPLLPLRIMDDLGDAGRHEHVPMQTLEALVPWNVGPMTTEDITSEAANGALDALP